MNRWTWIAVGGAWSLFVFLLTGWLTFPSSAAAARLSYELEEITDGALAVDIDAVGPWWFGVAAQGVRLATVQDDGEVLPVFFGDRVALRAGPVGALRRQPTVVGRVVVGEGTLDVEADLDAREPRTATRRLELTGDELPVEDLLLAAFRGSGGVGVRGAVDVDLDVTTPEGLPSADGDLSIQGRGVVLETLTVDALGWTDKQLDAQVDELDVRIRIEKGTAKIVRGLLRTSLASLELDGSLELAERFDRSKLELEVVLRLADWAGTPLETFRSLVEGFLRTAQWADGSYHYKVSTMLGRFGMSDLRPDRERTRPSIANPTPTPREATRVQAATPDAGETPAPTARPERRRPAALDRAARAGLRRPSRPASGDPAEPDDVDELDELDELDDEEPDDELDAEEMGEIDEAY
ncbi:MAG: type II secretion system protein GspN [Alphaproteobacteria bacterium]|nr:type II secretion system protein GspN [Alphaproteobacteria bacterium]